LVSFDVGDVVIRPHGSDLSVRDYRRVALYGVAVDVVNLHAVPPGLLARHLHLAGIVFEHDDVAVRADTGRGSRRSRPGPRQHHPCTSEQHRSDHRE
jgi:hypothetical protein